MRWFVPLVILGSVVISFPVLAQLGQLGPSGDFRVNDRPGTAPTVGPPGGPSLSPGPTLFRDPTGAKSPDEILKSLDKDLGRNTFGSPGSASSDRPFELEKDLRPSSEVFK